MSLRTWFDYRRHRADWATIRNCVGFTVVFFGLSAWAISVTKPPPPATLAETLAVIIPTALFVVGVFSGTVAFRETISPYRMEREEEQRRHDGEMQLCRDELSAAYGEQERLREEIAASAHRNALLRYGLQLISAGHAPATEIAADALLAAYPTPPDTYEEPAEEHHNSTVH